ncbi:MAG: hypothetical protein H7Z14_05755 [Anaerolineae bacterium]|nr:hypothetical protein [Phycisphaerae bacterium]
MSRQPVRSIVAVDQLEARRMFATQISFTDFSSTAGLFSNGFGSGPISISNRLRLTDAGQQNQARSVWFGTAVPITQFRTDFTFRISGNSGQEADGLTFTMQAGDTTALGGDGNNLGYGGINNSEAVTFNAFNLTNFGSRFGFASDGATPPIPDDMSPIDLHSGHQMKGTVRYDGTTLSVFVTDSTDRSQLFTASQTIDLPTALGANSVIVGFTAATGLFWSTQEVFSWSYTGGRAPTVTTAAAGVATSGSDKSFDLSALFANPDGTESDLTYTWTTDRKPSGAPNPTFSPNGSNASKASTVTFGKDGGYTLRVTATNSAGDSSFSRVTINVAQVATALRMTPHAQTIALGATLDYNATVRDQFGHNLRTQPAIVFSVQSGGGTIDSTSGLYTAPNAKGHVVIAATADDLTGTVGATVNG